MNQNTTTLKLPIILASASPARLELLKQIYITPDLVLPADIDETENRGELSDKLAQRLSFEKASKIASEVSSGIIIAADTVVVAGRKILPKAKNQDEVKFCISALSQRRHRVYTGLCIIKKNSDQTIIRQKIVQTIIKFRHIDALELDFYSRSNEGVDKAGGYTLSGYAQSFVSFISGSYSNVIGLPLLETVNALKSLDYYIYK